MISLIVPTRNEENIVKDNLIKINNFMKNNFSEYEIIVSDFSTDNTPNIVKNIGISNIKYIRSERKGIGAGIKQGFINAKYNIIMFYPIDCSWNFCCIKLSYINILERYDVVIGSRLHYASKSERPLKRKILSYIYNNIVNTFFHLDIKDTQGTCAVRKSELLKFIDKLDLDSATFQVQLLIHAKLNNLKNIEIPVRVKDIRSDSKINIFTDSYTMLKELIQEYIKLK